MPACHNLPYLLKSSFFGHNILSTFFHFFIFFFLRVSIPSSLSITLSLNDNKKDTLPFLLSTLHVRDIFKYHAQKALGYLNFPHSISDSFSKPLTFFFSKNIHQSACTKYISSSLCSFILFFYSGHILEIVFFRQATSCQK